MTDGRDAHRAAERVARESYGRLVAFLASRTGDIAGAEDALAEAFAQALATWPGDGVPDNPEGWLLTVARRRQSDSFRRRQTAMAAEPHLAILAEEADMRADGVSEFPDRRLALMFACAHPEIEPPMRTPLMLQVLLGLSADQIGAAYLVPGKTMGQRLVRAKARLGKGGIALEVPDNELFPRRLGPVLDAIYAAYGHDWARSGDAGALAEEAVWLAHLVVGLVSDAPEAKGLLALLLYLEARRPAARDGQERYVPLEDQDPSAWNRELIDAAESALHAASRAGPTGRYQIEAAIQSAHCARRIAGTTDWPSIVRLYDVLCALAPGPVVALNRAAARAHIEGPDASLAELEPLLGDRRMASYQPFWATRAHLCALAGRKADALEAYTLAIGLSVDPAVRAFLMARMECIRDG